MLDINSILLVGGVSVMVLTEILVKIVKLFTTNTKYLAVLNVVFAIAITLVAKYFGEISLSYLDSVVFGLMVGATTAGFYNFRTDSLGLKV